MEETRTLRVLVVDDSARVRRAISNIVHSELAPVEVVTAGNGRLALERTAKTEFDLITLDLSMPVMDGFTFLRLLRGRSPVPVLVVSALADIKNVEKALEAGADAFMGKPGDLAKNEEVIREEFRLKLKKLLPVQTLARHLSRGGRPPDLERAVRPPEGGGRCSGDFPVVVIGSSSGGPPSLQYLLSGLSADFASAIIIAQHMPKGFIAGMVERLKRLFNLQIREAAHGDPVEPGVIYFCPGGAHMEVAAEAGQPRFVVADSNPRDISPSVDVLFNSAARVFGKRLMGVVLTGMGKDGSEGVKAIKAAGGVVLAESNETAVIYGMPREAAATGCVDVVAPLPDIAVALMKRSASREW